MDNTNDKFPEISADVAAMLFEPETDIEEPLLPEESEEVGNEEEYEINAETILKEVLSVDDDGHCPSIIIATLEKLIDVEDGMDLSDIPDENREYVDDLVIEDCAVDMYTLDGILFNLILKFDSVYDAYLKDINEMCNRYRSMQEKMARSKNDEKVPMFSITFMPDRFKGLGAMVASFPVGFFRILDDDDNNCAFLMQFWATNVAFSKVDIDSETRSELVADVLREIESSENGYLYEE